MKKEIKLRQGVYESIVNSIGNRMPECGGVLGAGEDGIITEYYFDETGRSEPDAYIPDVEAINRVLEEWHERGIHMVGIVHSHREGVIAPSCGDIAYGMQILQALDTVDEFYLPILKVLLCHPKSRNGVRTKKKENARKNENN